MEELVQQIEIVSGENDPAGLQRACNELKERLPKQPGAISQELARRVLNSLRSNRHFEKMKEMAQAFIDDGCEDAQIVRQYSQALIDTGFTNPAIGMLEGIIQNQNTPSEEIAEAKGVLGRAWKEKALAARGVRDALAANASKKSYNSYKAVYEEDKKALYQGINRIALAAWDRGLSLESDEIADALSSAEDILSEVKNIPIEERPAWDLATAGEALIAMGRNKEAIPWFKDYATHEDTDAFALAGTVRQLTQVWRLGDEDGGQTLLAPLRARLLTLPGGSFSISKDDVLAMAAVDQDDYEKVLGDDGPKTFTWMKKGFEIASSVALIRQNGRGIGTGFLVCGKDLREDLGDELMVLTNSHVVSDPPILDAALPTEATVTFEASTDENIYEVDGIVWQSPPEAHDASLLRLTPAVDVNSKPMRFSKNLPVLDANQRQGVYIIGHPKGGELSFSFEDNELLDYEIHLVGDDSNSSPCRIHYRTPTERGSSGSPVFNSNWATIALHHKGSKSLAKLNGKDGLYGANEGIWIQSIIRAMNQICI